MKNSLSCFLFLLSLAGMPQVNVQCQTIDVGMTAQFWLNNPTNVNFHVTMDGVTVLSGSGMGDSNSPCGPVLSMSTTVPIDTTHEYLVEWGPLAYCQWALPGDDRVSGFFVSGIPNCAVVTFRDWYTNVHDTTWWIEEDHDLGYFYFSVNTNLGKVKFDVCDDSLPADGRSKAGAYLQGPSVLPAPITWSIVGPDLGCQLLTNGPVIIAGTNTGTITVRAKGTNNCYVDGFLDLYDPGDDSGCPSGTCPASSPSTSGENGGGSAGLASFSQSGSLGSGSLAPDGVDLKLSMGQSAGGRSAGYIRLYQPNTTTNIHFPAGLQFNFQRPDVTVIRDDSGNLRQVRSAQGLADISPNDFSESSYQINFYSSSNVGPKGVTAYATSGVPLVVWTLSSSNYLDDSYLKIVEAPVGGVSKTNIYIWDTDDTVGWKLIRPDGTSIKISDTTYAGIRTEAREIRSASGALVKYYRKQFQTFDFGERVIQEINGLDPNSQTNSYAYYTNGLLQQTVRSDGSWQYFLYNTNGYPLTVFSSYLNQDVTTNRSLCRVTDYDYSTSVVSGSGDDGSLQPELPRKVTESVQGNITSVRYTVVKTFERQEITCVTGTNWNSSGNLVTTNRSYDSGPFYQQLKTVDHPDGTMEFYEYATSLARYQTNTVWSGQANSTRTAVIDGTKTITATDPVGQMLWSAVIDVASGITTSYELYSDPDSLGRPQKVTHLDGTYDYTVYSSCCGLQTVTNREGTVTTSTYDDEKRLSTITRNGITTARNYDAAANVLSTTRNGTDNSAITLSSSGYDSSGRMFATTNAVGDPTSFSTTVYPVVKTTTLPNAATRIESYARDGSLLGTTGTGVHPTRFTNGLVSDGGVTRYFTAEIKLNTDGADTSEMITNFYDLAGRVYKTAYAGTNGAASLFYFNGLGQMTNQLDPDGVSTLYVYNARGEPEYMIIDMNRNGQIDWSGGDRITRTVNIVTNDASLNLLRTCTYVWNTSADSALLVSQNDRTVDGLTSWQISYGLTNQTVVSYSSGHKYVTSTAPDGSYSGSDFQGGRLLSSYRKDSAGGYLSQIGYSYDAHGRQNAVTNTPVGATTYTFDNADRVTSAATPAPAQTTSTIYNNMGDVATNILSDGAVQVFEYFATRDKKKEYGARQYPVEYTFDSQGRKKTMKTWQNFAANSGTATTTWNLDPYRGWVTSKIYADGNGETFTYTAAGRQKTHGWARGVTTTFSLDAAGAITNVAYSDSTPSVVTAFDRRGRPLTVVQGTNTTSFIVSDAGLVLCEGYKAGVLNGFAVTNIYDSLNRRTSVGVLSNGVWVTIATNSWDAASRMSFISDGTNSASYAFLTNSALVASIVMKSNTTTRLTIAKGYDNLFRLTVISNIPSADSAMTFTYGYNSANQRTSVIEADGSQWIYTYDSLGQVTSGKKYWSDGTWVAGQQFEYGFDDIGNRRYAGEGGNQRGTGLRYQNYSVNSLNQYTQRTVPGAVDVIGAANSGATVTVNLQPTYRRSDYFRAEPKINNTTSPVFQAITNVGVLANGTNADIVATNSGYALIPKTPEVYVYDVDGNLRTNGLWVLTWDGENRLASADSASAVPASAKQSLRFAYDSRSRRISKVVSNWTGNTWSLSYCTKFIYDGWNLLAEVNATNNAVIRSYIWGIDLSGAPQRAGGVGGLLAMRDSSGSTATNYFYEYDGNFNVRGLIDNPSGISTAEYQYGPFAELIRNSGTAASFNNFTFSSKRREPETGWSHYGYRELANGWWLNRDPIEERGGRNLYAFVRNDPIRNTDSLGLVDFDFKVIRNTGGPHGGNNTGDWGSPGWAFKSSSFTYDLTSATSTIIGKGPARSACCNTVIGSGADNTAAGSFDVIMYNAEVGNWEVALEYIADLSILGGKKGDNAQASNRFMRGLFNPPLLWGNITLQSSDGTVVGPTWYGANPQVYLAYEYFSNPGERRTISSYGVTVNFNHCGPITVTAVGTINVLYWNKIN